MNAVASLNTYSHKKQLQNLGISQKNAQVMLDAISRGAIILECPLKSIREIIDVRGRTKTLAQVATTYEKNKMNPIDNVKLLSGLKLNIFLYFVNPDEVISNRDDDLFSARLKQANSGKTVVIIGKAGGHVGYHSELWHSYKQVIK